MNSGVAILFVELFAILGVASLIVYFGTKQYDKIRKLKNPNYESKPMDQLPSYLFFKWALEYGFRRHYIDVFFVMILVLAAFNLITITAAMSKLVLISGIGLSFILCRSNVRETVDRGNIEVPGYPSLIVFFVIFTGTLLRFIDQQSKGSNGFHNARWDLLLIIMYPTLGGVFLALMEIKVEKIIGRVFKRF